MASILLPPALSAVGALSEALLIAQSSIATGITYGSSMINIVDPFGRTTAPITAILTAITPAKPMGPPALLTIPNCLAVTGEIEQISGYINAAQIQSIAGPPTPAGAPTPSPIFLAPPVPQSAGAINSKTPILSIRTNRNTNYINQPIFNPIGSPWFVVQQITELIKFIDKNFVKPQQN